MAVDHFPEALAFTLKYEGGYNDTPGDHGGATNFGVTQAVYDDWRDLCHLPRESVRGIKRATVENIYRTQYWKAAGCDGLDRRLGMVMFDCAVNHGVGQAKRFLQRAQSKSDMALDVLAQRDAFYRMLAARPQQGQFLKGWLVRNRALVKAIGPDRGTA